MLTEYYTNVESKTAVLVNRMPPQVYKANIDYPQ